MSTWEGVVVSVEGGGETFFAQLWSPEGWEMVADMVTSSVREGDRHLVRPGALFRTDGTSIWFRRVPPLTPQQIEEAARRARERRRRLFGLGQGDGWAS